MTDTKARMEAMLFDYQTTNKSDYRHRKITIPTLTKYKEIPRSSRVKPPALKDLHTMTAWKTTSVPFSLMHSPKPILRTDPNKAQEPYVEPPDTEKELSIKTRPRIVLSPAGYLDDVTDQRARNILLDYMYTSSTMRAAKEAISDYYTVKAPLPRLPAPANPIKLPKLNVPYVSPEWRMDTVSWDKKQLRSYCDSTKEFWQGRELSAFNARKEMCIAEADRKMHSQMEARAGKH